MKASELIEYLESKTLSGKDFEVFFENEFGAHEFTIEEIILEGVKDDS